MADDKPKARAPSARKARRTRAARRPPPTEAAEEPQQQPEPESERLERLREVLQRKATFG